MKRLDEKRRFKLRQGIASRPLGTARIYPVRTIPGGKTMGKLSEKRWVESAIGLNGKDL
jgi:hypothetical protein